MKRRRVVLTALMALGVPLPVIAEHKHKKRNRHNRCVLAGGLCWSPTDCCTIESPLKTGVSQTCALAWDSQYRCVGFGTSCDNDLQCWPLARCIDGGLCIPIH
jgi:hypothetical protein